VDKGYLGSSGATAPSGTGVWYIQPDERLRQEAKLNRYDLGGQLSEDKWMNRVLDKAYERMNHLAEWGYPFPADEQGTVQIRALQGPEYMKMMRKLVGEGIGS
jgi:succinate dehydrogenase/fumarate reductase flavoprotein subunit